MKIAMVACEPAPNTWPPSGTNLEFRSVSAQVVEVDVAVVIDERQSDAVGGVGVDPAAIGDERDHAAADIVDAVAWPSGRRDVGVVERALAACG